MDVPGTHVPLATLTLTKLVSMLDKTPIDLTASDEDIATSKASMGIMADDKTSSVENVGTNHEDHASIDLTISEDDDIHRFRCPRGDSRAARKNTLARACS